MWSDTQAPRRGAAFWLGLPALVLLIHWPALFAYFEADDVLWVIHHGWRDGWSAVAGSWGLGVAWRPVTRLSFLADAVLFGWNAWPWHAVNLALHAANALLVACLARRAGATPTNAWLTAALFAALPLDWENVDWISGRTGELCLLFLLAASLSWLRHLQGRGGMVRACAFLIGAMLSYEPAAVLPLALLPVLLLGVFPRRRVGMSLVWLSLTSAGILLLRWAVLQTPFVATDVASTSYVPNLGLNLVRLGVHAWRGFGPAGFALVAAVVMAGLWRGRTRLAVMCCLLSAAVLYLPFTPVAGFTERFLYLAGVPVAAGLMMSLASLPAARSAACVLLLLFGLRAHAQAQGFRMAGDLTRRILADIAAIPDDGANLVFDQVPTHDGPYYLLWANFDDAAASVRHAHGFMTTSEYLLWHPDLLQRARTQPTHFFAWRAAAKDFREISAADWRHLHGVAGPGLAGASGLAKH